MPGANYKIINLILTCSANYIISNAACAKTFPVNDTKISVPVVPYQFKATQSYYNN